MLIKRVSVGYVCAFQRLHIRHIASKANFADSVLSTIFSVNFYCEDLFNLFIRDAFCFDLVVL